MKQHIRDHLVFLDDMVTSIGRIMNYTRGMSATDFKNNQMVIDAVVRNFEIIGEASQKIPASVKERYPEIPGSRCTA